MQLDRADAGRHSAVHLDDEVCSLLDRACNSPQPKQTT